MADWITILILIALGIVLLVLEIIVVPGTTVVGAIGGLLVVVGVVLTFKNYGSTIKHYKFILYSFLLITV